MDLIGIGYTLFGCALAGLGLMFSFQLLSCYIEFDIEPYEDDYDYTKNK